MQRRIMTVQAEECVACGCCEKVCPRQAAAVFRGSYAVIQAELCVGCGLCAAACPAGCLHPALREDKV